MGLFVYGLLKVTVLVAPIPADIEDERATQTERQLCMKKEVVLMLF
jgi:hypothetical protein